MYVNNVENVLVDVIVGVGEDANKSDDVVFWVRLRRLNLWRSHLANMGRYGARRAKVKMWRTLCATI